MIFIDNFDDGSNQRFRSSLNQKQSIAVRRFYEALTKKILESGFTRGIIAGRYAPEFCNFLFTINESYRFYRCSLAGYLIHDFFLTFWVK